MNNLRYQDAAEEDLVPKGAANIYKVPTCKVSVYRSRGRAVAGFKYTSAELCEDAYIFWCDDSPSSRSGRMVCLFASNGDVSDHFEEMAVEKGHDHFEVYIQGLSRINDTLL